MKEERLRVAVIGAGYFGSLHAEKLSRLPNVQLSAVVDVDRHRANKVAGVAGAVALCDTSRVADLADAAVVAVPTSAHFEVASRLAGDGLHLLVEKPLAANAEDAKKLCELADRKGVMLQVGYLERFSRVRRMLLGMAQRPRAVRVIRQGPFTGRGGDVDVVREVMVHDLDLLLQMAGKQPERVRARGREVITGHLDEAEARLGFDTFDASIRVSRVAERAERKVEVTLGDGERLVADLVKGTLTRFVNGSEEILQCAGGQDPLYVQDSAFVAALFDGHKPAVAGRDTLATIALAERIYDAAVSGEVD